MRMESIQRSKVRGRARKFPKTVRNNIFKPESCQREWASCFFFFLVLSQSGDSPHHHFYRWLQSYHPEHHTVGRPPADRHHRAVGSSWSAPAAHQGHHTERHPQPHHCHPGSCQRWWGGRLLILEVTLLFGLSHRDDNAPSFNPAHFFPQPLL